MKLHERFLVEIVVPVAGLVIMIVAYLVVFFAATSLILP